MKLVCGNIMLTLKRCATLNEWRVCWFENGCYCESKTYFTDDRQDAVNTMNAMFGRLVCNG